jgi:hypothetical protein
MIRNPGAYRDADGGDFLSIEPDTGLRGLCVGGYAMIGQGTDDDSLQIAHICVQISPVSGQIYYGVADYLPGPMVCQPAAATDTYHGDTVVLQCANSDFICGSRAPPHGYHRRVRKQQQPVIGISGEFALDQRLLHTQGGDVLLLSAAGHHQPFFRCLQVAHLSAPVAPAQTHVVFDHGVE